MNDKKYPIKVALQIDSSTHENFELSEFAQYGDQLSITKDRNTYSAVFFTEVTENYIEKHVWRVLDALCLALSITQSGIFARHVYYGKGGGLAGIKWLDGFPSSAAATRVTVLDVRNYDSSKTFEAENLFNTILNVIDTDDTLKAALIAYTVSCRFFNLDIIRESAINFFTVAEIVATAILPRALSSKSTYQLKDLQKAGEQLGVDKNLVQSSYKVRGELAHGHSNHLLLMEHSLGEHEVSSYSLKLPALECKKLADEFLSKYLQSL